MSRPRTKPATETSLTIRLTDEQRAIVGRVASRLGLRPSTWIRSIALDAAARADGKIGKRA